MKNELRNLGYFLITPFPQKYHFEGVNNTRSARQFAVIIGAAYVSVFAAYILHEPIKEIASNTKAKLQSKKNK